MSRVIVYHRSYGCDTGCCGHIVELDGEDVGPFEFGHPALTHSDPSKNDDPRQWAEDLVRRALGEEHVKDLDWEHCVIVDD